MPRFISPPYHLFVWLDFFVCPLLIHIKLLAGSSFSHLSSLPLYSPLNTPGVDAHHQDLEEELELHRKRVSEAEGVAKRAEEELAVAKERLLLQEDELQSRAGWVWLFTLSSCSSVVVKWEEKAKSAKIVAFPLFLIRLSPHASLLQRDAATSCYCSSSPDSFLSRCRDTKWAKITGFKALFLVWLV